METTHDCLIPWIKFECSLEVENSFLVLGSETVVVPDDAAGLGSVLVNHVGLVSQVCQLHSLLLNK